MKSLSNKQFRFVQEYIIDMNATQAAIRAGYSPKSARNQGSRLMTNDDILVAINQLISDFTMSAQEVLVRLTEIARGNIGEFLKINGFNIEIDLEKIKDKDSCRVLKKVKQRRSSYIDKQGNKVESTVVEIELYDRLDAIEMLGKYHRMFVDRSENSDKGGVPLINLERVNASLEKIYGRYRQSVEN